MRHRYPDMQAGAVTLRHELPMIFNPNPLNPDGSLNLYDGLVGIRPDDDLLLTITWGAAAALGANRTIGAAVVRIHYIEAIPERTTERPRWFPQWFSGLYTPGQTFANLGGTVQLDTGLWYRRVHLMALKGATPNDVRTDGTAGDAISEIGIKASDNRAPIASRFTDFSQSSQSGVDVADDNSAVAGATLAPGAAVSSVAYNLGYGYFDLARGGDPGKIDPVFGTSLVGAPLNALRIGATVDSVTNVNLVYMTEGYNQYPS
jgi:hypothetical protein